MARVDYTGVPTEQVSLEAPSDYSHAEASPASFGAAVAEGGQALGQGVLDASKFYDRVSADQASNNLIQQATNLLHGGPGKMVVGPDGKPTQDSGFLGLRGANAMSAYKDTASALDDAINEQRAGLKTPLARLQFDTDTRRNRSAWMAQMGTHADDQQRVWATDTNNTQATLGLNAVSRVASDDTAAAAAGEPVRQALVRNAQLAGEDPEGALLKADQQIALTRIHTLAADPATAPQAQHVLDQSKGVLGSLPGYDGIVRQVKAAVIDATMTPAVDSFVSDAVTGAARQVASGGTPASVADVHPPAPALAKATQIRDRLATDLGISPSGASGLISNLVAESGLRGIEENHALAASSGQTGGYDFGWAQWHGPRRAAFEQWANQHGLDPSSDAANYGYLA